MTVIVIIGGRGGVDVGTRENFMPDPFSAFRAFGDRDR